MLQFWEGRERRRGGGGRGRERRKSGGGRGREEEGEGKAKEWRVKANKDGEKEYKNNDKDDDN